MHNMSDLGNPSVFGRFPLNVGFIYQTWARRFIQFAFSGNFETLDPLYYRIFNMSNTSNQVTIYNQQASGCVMCDFYNAVADLSNPANNHFVFIGAILH